MKKEFQKEFNEWLWSDDPEVKKENPFINFISKKAKEWPDVENTYDYDKRTNK